jgi:outer membrane receptor protein involved in Fe transport
MTVSYTHDNYLIIRPRGGTVYALLLCCCLLDPASPEDRTPVAASSLFPVVAQTDTTLPPQPLERLDTLRFHDFAGLVVSVARTSVPLLENPAATTVVGPRDLEAMPRTVAVDEALRMVPGVKVDNQADGERGHMSIRGQGILSERGLRGIKVLQDGLPLNDPTGFAPDLYDVDWSDVERIEVLRGPGASLYGGGATAGVLNIVTAPAGEGPALVAEGHAGSSGFWKTAARSSGRFR